MSSVYKLVLLRLEVGASTQSVLGFTKSWCSLQVGACNQRLQPHLSWCSNKERCTEVKANGHPKKKRFFPYGFPQEKQCLCILCVIEYCSCVLYLILS